MEWDELPTAVSKVVNELCVIFDVINFFLLIYNLLLDDLLLDDVIKSSITTS